MISICKVAFSVCAYSNDFFKKSVVINIVNCSYEVSKTQISHSLQKIFFCINGYNNQKEYSIIFYS